MQNKAANESRVGYRMADSPPPFEGPLNGAQEAAERRGNVICWLREAIGCPSILVNGTETAKAEVAALLGTDLAGLFAPFSGRGIDPYKLLLERGGNGRGNAEGPQKNILFKGVKERRNRIMRISNPFETRGDKMAHLSLDLCATITYKLGENAGAPPHNKTKICQDFAVRFVSVESADLPSPHDFNTALHRDLHGFVNSDIQGGGFGGNGRLGENIINLGENKINLGENKNNLGENKINLGENKINLGENKNHLEENMSADDRTVNSENKRGMDLGEDIMEGGACANCDPLMYIRSGLHVSVNASFKKYADYMFESTRWDGLSTLIQPIGSILIVSSSDTDPVFCFHQLLHNSNLPPLCQKGVLDDHPARALLFLDFEDLTYISKQHHMREILRNNLSHTADSGGEDPLIGGDNIPPECGNIPPLFEGEDSEIPNLPIHVGGQGSLAEERFRKIKGAFPPDICFQLKLGRYLVGEENLEKEGGKGLERGESSEGGKGLEGGKSESEDVIENHEFMREVYLQTLEGNMRGRFFRFNPESSPPFSRTHQIPPAFCAGLSWADLHAVRRFVREFILSPCVGWIERKVRDLETSTSTPKKGLRNQLKALWRRPKAFSLSEGGAAETFMSTLAGAIGEGGGMRGISEYASHIYTDISSNKNIISSLVGTEPAQFAHNSWSGHPLPPSSVPEVSNPQESNDKGGNESGENEKGGSQKGGRIEKITLNIVEWQNRLLADLYYHIGNYDQAFVLYKICAGEFRHEKQFALLGAVLNMCGICLYLISFAKIDLNIKKDINAFFSQAYMSFLRSGRPDNAICTIILSNHICFASDPLDSHFLASAASKLLRLSADVQLRSPLPSPDSHMTSQMQPRIQAEQEEDFGAPGSNPEEQNTRKKENINNTEKFEKNEKNRHKNENKIQHLQQNRPPENPPPEYIKNTAKPLEQKIAFLKSALSLEEAATFSALGGRRKSRFQYLLAGHTYKKGGYISHALRCYIHILGEFCPHSDSAPDLHRVLSSPPYERVLPTETLNWFLIRKLEDFLGGKDFSKALENSHSASNYTEGDEWAAGLYEEFLEKVEKTGKKKKIFLEQGNGQWPRLSEHINLCIARDYMSLKMVDKSLIYYIKYFNNKSEFTEIDLLVSGIGAACVPRYTFSSTVQFLQMANIFEPHNNLALFPAKASYLSSSLNTHPYQHEGFPPLDSPPSKDAQHLASLLYLYGHYERRVARRLAELRRICGSEKAAQISQNSKEEDVEPPGHFQEVANDVIKQGGDEFCCGRDLLGYICEETLRLPLVYLRNSTGGISDCVNVFLWEGGGRLGSSDLLEIQKMLAISCRSGDFRKGFEVLNPPSLATMSTVSPSVASLRFESGAIENAQLLYVQKVLDNHFSLISLLHQEALDGIQYDSSNMSHNGVVGLHGEDQNLSYPLRISASHLPLTVELTIVNPLNTPLHLAQIQLNAKYTHKASPALSRILYKTIPQLTLDPHMIKTITLSLLPLETGLLVIEGFACYVAHKIYVQHKIFHATTQKNGNLKKLPPPKCPSTFLPLHVIFGTVGGTYELVNHIKNNYEKNIQKKSPKKYPKECPKEPPKESPKDSPKESPPKQHPFKKYPPHYQLSRAEQKPFLFSPGCSFCTLIPKGRVSPPTNLEGQNILQNWPHLLDSSFGLTRKMMPTNLTTESGLLIDVLLSQIESLYKFCRKCPKIHGLYSQGKFSSLEIAGNPRMAATLHNTRNNLLQVYKCVNLCRRLIEKSEFFDESLDISPFEPIPPLEVKSVRYLLPYNDKAIRWRLALQWDRKKQNHFLFQNFNPKNTSPKNTSLKNPPSENLPSKNPLSKKTSSNNSPSKNPTSKNPPSENLASKNPPSENPPSNYPPSNNSPSKNPPSNNPPSENPASKNPSSENPASNNSPEIEISRPSKPHKIPIEHQTDYEEYDPNHLNIYTSEDKPIIKIHIFGLPSLFPSNPPFQTYVFQGQILHCQLVIENLVPDLQEFQTAATDSHKKKAIIKRLEIIYYPSSLIQFVDALEENPIFCADANSEKNSKKRKMNIIDCLSQNYCGLQDLSKKDKIRISNKARLALKYKLGVIEPHEAKHENRFRIGENLEDKMGINLDEKMGENVEEKMGNNLGKNLGEEIAEQKEGKGMCGKKGEKTKATHIGSHKMNCHIIPGGKMIFNFKLKADVDPGIHRIRMLARISSISFDPSDYPPESFIPTSMIAQSDFFSQKLLPDIPHLPLNYPPPALSQHPSSALYECKFEQSWLECEKIFHSVSSLSVSVLPTILCTFDEESLYLSVSVSNDAFAHRLRVSATSLLLESGTGEVNCFLGSQDGNQMDENTQKNDQDSRKIDENTQRKDQNLRKNDRNIWKMPENTNDQMLKENWNLTQTTTPMDTADALPVQISFPSVSAEEDINADMLTSGFDTEEKYRAICRGVRTQGDSANPLFFAPMPSVVPTSHLPTGDQMDQNNGDLMANIPDLVRGLRKVLEIDPCEKKELCCKINLFGMMAKYLNSKITLYIQWESEEIFSGSGNRSFGISSTVFPSYPPPPCPLYLVLDHRAGTHPQQDGDYTQNKYSENMGNKYGKNMEKKYSLKNKEIRVGDIVDVYIKLINTSLISEVEVLCCADPYGSQYSLDIQSGGDDGRIDGNWSCRGGEEKHINNTKGEENTMKGNDQIYYKQPYQYPVCMAKSHWAISPSIHSFLSVPANEPLDFHSGFFPIQNGKKGDTQNRPKKYKISPPPQLPPPILFNLNVSDEWSDLSESVVMVEKVCLGLEELCGGEKRGEDMEKLLKKNKKINLCLPSAKPATGYYFLGSTEKYVGKIEPQKFKKFKISVYCPIPGIFNLNQLFFAASWTDSAGQIKKFPFFFPHQHLIHVQ